MKYLLNSDVFIMNLHPTKELNHLLSRIYALTYTIETTLKYLITKLSLYYYNYRISRNDSSHNFYYLQKYEKLIHPAPIQGRSAVFNLLDFFISKRR